MTSLAGGVQGARAGFSAQVKPVLLGALSAGAIPVALFSAFLLAAGVSPIDAFSAMVQSAVGTSYGFGEVLVRAAPFALTALAAAIPARAGLINVGAEGQLVFGALFSAALATALGDVGPIGLPFLHEVGRRARKTFRREF